MSVVGDDDPRVVVRDLVSGVTPYDDREKRDQAWILEWVASGAPLFRTQPPRVPPTHLATYFVLLDDEAKSVVLVDHVKAGLWLPPGGHVEPGENPRRTAIREAEEELGITPRFHDQLGAGDPLFLTVTQTVGPHSHTDVTLWFVLVGDRNEHMTPDEREFRGVGWFGLDEPISWDAGTFDPQWPRFVQKLTSAWEQSHTPTGTSAR